MSILAIIPARGGSKGVPRKNLVSVAGKPLICWTIEAACACPCLERIVVTTDDPAIAEVSRQAGADVPFQRPAELAQDDTPGIAPVLHAVQWLENHEGYLPEYVALLQPTSPLRTPDDIGRAVDLAVGSGADSVVSVCEVKDHPYWVLRRAKDGSLRSFDGHDWGEILAKYPRRQDLPSAYAENGAIYLVRRDVLLQRQSFYGDALFGYLMPRDRSVDIDCPLDIQIAEMLLQRRSR